MSIQRRFIFYNMSNFSLFDRHEWYFNGVYRSCHYICRHQVRVLDFNNWIRLLGFLILLLLSLLSMSLKEAKFFSLKLSILYQLFDFTLFCIICIKLLMCKTKAIAKCFDHIDETTKHLWCLWYFLFK
jgi:hypothetical protein